MLIIRIIVVVINSFDSCVKSENRKLSRDWRLGSREQCQYYWRLEREARVRTEQRQAPECPETQGLGETEPGRRAETTYGDLCCPV